MRMTTTRCLIGLGLCLSVLPAWANVKLPAVIGSNMVLQQDQSIRIWGWADAGEEVTVTLGDSQVKAMPGSNGRWQVELPALTKPDGPLEMTVKGKNELKLTNILVGEVWAGSGQSNMQWAVNQSQNAAKEIAEAKFPKIRLFLVQLLPSGTPAEDVGVPPNSLYGRWVECSPETVPGSSAVLYFFGREIHQQLDVPVGLITTAWGGTRIQPWIPPQGYAAIPELAEEQRQYKAALQSYVDAMKNFGKAAEAWAAKAQGRTDAEMPFLFAQLAPFDYGGDPTRLPGIWHRQILIRKHFSYGFNTMEV